MCYELHYHLEGWLLAFLAGGRNSPEPGLIRPPCTLFYKWCFLCESLRNSDVLLHKYFLNNHNVSPKSFIDLKMNHYTKKCKKHQKRAELPRFALYYLHCWSGRGSYLASNTLVVFSTFNFVVTESLSYFIYYSSIEYYFYSNYPRHRWRILCLWPFFNQWLLKN